MSRYHRLARLVRPGISDRPRPRRMTFPCGLASSYLGLHGSFVSVDARLIGLDSYHFGFTVWDFGVGDLAHVFYFCMDACQWIVIVFDGDTIVGVNEWVVHVFFDVGRHRSLLSVHVDRCIDVHL